MASLNPPVVLVSAGLALAAAAIGLAMAAGARDVAAPVVGGMVGPLAATLLTWAVVVRTHRANPAGVMPVMVGAFVAKLLFFVAYVVVVVKVVGLNPAAFGLSFAGFFISLYAVEAVYFSRLFRGQLQGAR